MQSLKCACFEKEHSSSRIKNTGTKTSLKKKEGSTKMSVANHCKPITDFKPTVKGKLRLEFARMILCLKKLIKKLMKKISSKVFFALVWNSSSKSKLTCSWWGCRPFSKFYVSLCSHSEVWRFL